MLRETTARVGLRLDLSGTDSTGTAFGARSVEVAVEEALAAVTLYVGPHRVALTVDAVEVETVGVSRREIPA